LLWFQIAVDPKMVVTATEQLADLNRSADELNLQIARAKFDLDAASKEERRDKSALAILKFKHSFRAPKYSYNLWPLGMMLIAPLVAGVLMFIFGQTILSSGIALVWCIVGAVCLSAVVSANLLWIPTDSVLSQRLHEFGEKTRLASDKSNQAAVAVAQLKGRLDAISEKKRQITTSDQLKRESLLRRNWKELRGPEWEDYVAEACSISGGEVKRTGKVGDQGVDLVWTVGARRIAIQAKGYYHSVSNDAVQQVVAGMAYYGCNRCAVFTNSVFTSSAKDLAAINKCRLIGEEELPEFVLGRIEL
jgi:hypothetical protein